MKRRKTVVKRDKKPERALVVPDEKEVIETNEMLTVRDEDIPVTSGTVVIPDGEAHKMAREMRTWCGRYKDWCDNRASWENCRNVQRVYGCIYARYSLQVTFEVIK